MIISAITKFSTLDYPDNICMTLYTQGCNRECSYCHNKEFLPMETENQIPWSEVITEIASRANLIDAVVFSGGEPTIHQDLKEKALEVSLMGLLVGLHTNGDNLDHETATEFDYILLSHANKKKIEIARDAGSLSVSKVGKVEDGFENIVTSLW